MLMTSPDVHSHSRSSHNHEDSHNRTDNVSNRHMTEGPVQC